MTTPNTLEEQALEMVRDRFAVYILPGDQGPQLKDWQGQPAIVWEDSSPYEWAFLATAGGIDEELAGLMAELGQTVKPIEPIEWPEGLHAEPIMSFILGLYR